MGFPQPVWKKNIQELKEIRKAPPVPVKAPYKPAPPPKRTTSPAPKKTSSAPAPFIGPVYKPPVQPKPSGFIKTPVMQKIDEVQKIKESPPTKTVVPYKPGFVPQDPLYRTMTTGAYTQQRHSEMQDIQKQHSDFMSSYHSIDPFATYEFIGPSGKKTTAQGSVVREQYFEPFIKDFDTAQLESQKAWQQSRDLDLEFRGKIIQPKIKYYMKDKSYDVDVGNTSLEFTKRELAKIDKAYKINPLLGAVSEFGFGAVSAVGAMVEPIMKIKDPSRNIHPVSMWDIAFEPIGWSPKGSTKILKERPIFSAGSVGSEVVMAYGMTKAFEGIGHGVKVGTRIGTSKLVPVYSKIGSPLKLGSTKFGKNLYNWSVKGYTKGLRLAEKPIGTAVKETTKGGWKFKTVGQKFISGAGKGNVEKVWLSPTQKIAAEKALAKTLTNKATINFPTKLTLEQFKRGKPLSVVLKETKFGGLTGRKLITTQKTLYITRGKKPTWSLLSGKYRGFTRPLSKTNIQPSFYGTGTTKLKPYTGKFITPFETKVPGLEKVVSYLHYSKQIQPTRVLRGVTAGRISTARKIATEGFVKTSFDDPIKLFAKGAAKARHKWTLTHNPFKYFYSGREATQTLVPKISTDTILKPVSSGFSSGRLGLIQRLNAPILTNIGLPSVAYSIPYGASRFVSKPFTISHTKQDTGTKQFSFQTPTTTSKLDSGLDSIHITTPDFNKPKTITFSKTDTIPSSDLGIASVTLPDVKKDIGVAPVSISGTATALAYKQQLKPISFKAPLKSYHTPRRINKTVFQTPKLPLLAPLWIPKGVYGRGKRTGSFNLFGKGYKFRSVKIKDPFKAMKLKPTKLKPTKLKIGGLF